FRSGAERNELCARFGERQMAGRRVESIACLESLLVIAVACCPSPFDDDAPVRARTAVVRQTLEHGSGVDVFANGLEHDGVVVAQLCYSADVNGTFDRDGRGVLSSAWHWAPP